MESIPAPIKLLIGAAGIFACYAYSATLTEDVYKARYGEEQEKFLSNKLMLKTEQAHMEKLATQAGKARTFYPIKQTQWYT